MGDYSGGYEQDNVELNLVDSMDHHDDVEYSTHVSPGESGEAVRAMMKLPSGTQEQIRNLLLSNEKLQFVEKPSRWRSNIALIVASIIGTIIFIFVAAFHSKVNGNIIVVMAVFPLALLTSAYAIWRGEHRFLVFTDKRVLSKGGWSDTMIIEYSALVGVSVRYNYLMLMPELEIKHDLPITMVPKRNALIREERRTKTDYIDSVVHLERYRHFLQEKIYEKSAPGSQEVSDEEDLDV